MQIFKIKCPKCGWIQNRIAYRGLPKGKRIKCYKCEKSFTIHSNVNKTNIIKELK